MKITRWHFDEYQQIGRDYTSPEEVQVYDESHAQFRDIAKENNEALDCLKVSPGTVLLDIGCGTGTFAIESARRGLDVHAADVSKAMLAYAKDKAKGCDIVFHNAGFLTLEMAHESVDLITTTFAFHHLPDFWKGIALKRLFRMLKPSGRLYIRDVILEEDDALENIARLVEHQELMGGDFLREDAEGHFREENSTYDWVMDGLLSRAGFSILMKTFDRGVLGTYICRKTVQEGRGL
ncbi:MAG: methyltransferase domain-containing protein [Verrucomicrobia bacterium]|jgi:putative AdoMet-dependent methyltransferase|nr:methyltransferase domain-containing protein [Verrucomicrobiota bacterium]